MTKASCHTWYRRTWRLRQRLSRMLRGSMGETLVSRKIKQTKSLSKPKALDLTPAPHRKETKLSRLRWWQEEWQQVLLVNCTQGHCHSLRAVSSQFKLPLVLDSAIVQRAPHIFRFWPAFQSLDKFMVDLGFCISTCFKKLCRRTVNRIEKYSHTPQLKNSRF